MDKTTVFNLIDTKLKENNTELPKPMLDQIKSDFWGFYETLPERVPKSDLVVEDNDPKLLLVVLRMWLSGQSIKLSKRLRQSSYPFLALGLTVILLILLLIFRQLWQGVALIIVGGAWMLIQGRCLLTKEQHASIQEAIKIFDKINAAMRD